MALPPNPEPTGSADLPPVVPPSGQYIAQLFIVPLLIVVSVVLVMLGYTWLAGRSQSPRGFLDGLNSSNAEVRWRAASDLAQVLIRDDELAADPEFGLELTARLNNALPAMRKAVPPVEDDVPAQERRAAAAKRYEFVVQRSEVQYLAACLGNLSTPVGAAVLNEMAARPISPDLKSDAILRRQATWALASLGSNRKRFDRLSRERKEKVLAELDRRGAGAGDETNWARGAADYLRGNGSAGVISALAKCAEADDPFLRRQAALALSFWKGSPEENRLAEETLLRLTRDDGHGTIITVTDEKD